MRAIGFSKNLPISQSDALETIDVAEPTLGDNDLLVQLEATSINPADAKLRQILPELEDGHHVLGFDAVGRVLDKGHLVTTFSEGDRVWYAGSLTRPGTNSERHAVDHRITSKAPRSIEPIYAAALPLTAITAWEILFDRLALTESGGKGETLLVVGGAGGVGSILIQLAKRLTELRVVATASRAETREWVLKMGADEIVNHREDLVMQLNEKNVQIDYIAGLTSSDTHFSSYAEIIKPQGKIVLIDDPAPNSINITLLKPKSVSLTWEFMFTRSMFETDDIAVQGEILKRVANLVDEGQIRSTAKNILRPLTLENLKKAHVIAESGSAIGKTVLGEPQF